MSVGIPSSEISLNAFKIGEGGLAVSTAQLLCRHNSVQLAFALNNNNRISEQ